MTQDPSLKLPGDRPLAETAKPVDGYWAGEKLMCSLHPTEQATRNVAGDWECVVGLHVVLPPANPGW
ncbi:MAG TPA: hypothetical protein VGB75_14190 [Jatrophihabitans sp.]|uniref:hypothetical protein n=1 Tax=Jatrophihabitans sp. TaxID=1932789 RepID=UPI002F0BDE2D